MRSPFVQSPLLVAFLNPLNLAILALAAAAGLCAAWWLFPLGILFWAVMVIIVYRDPSLHMSNTQKTREPLAQRFQGPFDRIERGQVSLFNTISLAKGNIRSTLQPILDAVEKLVEKTYQLGKRMSAIENHRLVTKASRNLESDLADLNNKIASTTDEGVRRNYEESKKALEDRLNNLKSSDTLLDSFEAQLSSVSNTIDNMVTETVRLQAMDMSSIRGNLPALLEAIQAQADQLSSFENEIAGTLAGS